MAKTVMQQQANQHMRFSQMNKMMKGPKGQPMMPPGMRPMGPGPMGMSPGHGGPMGVIPGGPMGLHGGPGGPGGPMGPGPMRHMGPGPGPPMDGGMGPGRPMGPGGPMDNEENSMDPNSVPSSLSGKLTYYFFFCFIHTYNRPKNS